MGDWRVTVAFIAFFAAMAVLMSNGPYRQSFSTASEKCFEPLDGGKALYNTNPQGE